ncbi:DMT family transporter [Emticicia sp. C21]|uniref:DMT family transporter n=1 Tax=Emticicia sp. C21 TaxID=2302915 RepID=UPI000E341E35|nr:DMT family transporter [Emticicia sp. C21]RFS17730.1 DMT family transporter [Emticicia sp. C21]
MAEISITKITENTTSGLINGLIGVLVFSVSLPATRIAVQDLSPVFVTVARASMAGLLALGLLLIGKEKRPTRQQTLSLIIVAFGVVLGFPLLSALALQYVPSAHSIVFLGLLPLSTAIFGVIRGGERPRPVFWLFSIIGSLLVVGYAISQGLSASFLSDTLMLLAILVCGLGYAEGAKLSKTLGGWQVISWALVLSLPVMLGFTFWFFPTSVAHVRTEAWMSLGYVSVFSMLVGFIFWYRGLAQGGITVVGQLQLLQPLFGLVMAATLAHEEVNTSMLGVTVGVILCVAGAKKFAK